MFTVTSFTIKIGYEIILLCKIFENMREKRLIQAKKVIIIRSINSRFLKTVESHVFKFDKNFVSEWKTKSFL